MTDILDVHQYTEHAHLHPIKIKAATDVGFPHPDIVNVAKANRQL